MKRSSVRDVAALYLTLVITALGAGLAQGQEPAGKKKLTLERLYQYPRLEGTPPIQAKWSADGRKIAFLWNDQGMRFRDLWVYEVGSGELSRLTSLDQPRDQWTESSAEKDPKLRRYRPPEAGPRSFEWAKDSRQLAFAFRGELYLVRADGSRPPLRLTKTKEAESRPRFSPDSRQLAFVRTRELWVSDLDTGALVQLTSGASDDILNGARPYPESSLRTFEWSPDGRWLALVQIDRTGEPTRLVPNYSGVEVKTRKQRRTFAKDATPKLRLGVVPAEGGEVVWLTPAARQYYYDWRWAPDSTRIVLNRVEENWKRRHLEVLDVRRAVKEAKEAEKRKEKEKAKPPPWLRTLYTETDDKWMCTLCWPVEWSLDGEWILFLSERDGWNHLYLIRAKEKRPVSVSVGVRSERLRGGSIRQLTRGPWEVETGRAPLEMRPRFSPDSRRVYFTANKEDASVRHLYWVDTGGGEPYRLTDSPGYNAAVVSPDERRLALLLSSFAQPWELYVRLNTQGEPWRRVTNSPLREFARYDWPQPRLVEFPARDGKAVRALLFSPSEIAVRIEKYLPPAAAKRPGRPARPAVERVPVINFVHGAGYAQAVLNRWGGYNIERFHFNQFLAQQGYAVIDVDYRGSSGYGRNWRTGVYLHLGGKDLEDELAAMDYLETLAWVDTERAGIWGVSYGGFMTLMALSLSPDTFRAGSAWAAVTDWENYNRHYTQQRLRAPQEEPEAYRRSSPIHHVAGIKSPLQIQHGMVDDNVHFQDAVQLLDALVAAGKKFELVAYPQSDHGWVRPEVWLHSTRAAFDFFERHLKSE